MVFIINISKLGASFFLKISDTKISGVNVRTYEPSKRPDGKLPLLIYYHGGAFITGDAGMHEQSRKVLVINNLYMFLMLYLKKHMIHFW